MAMSRSVCASEAGAHPPLLVASYSNKAAYVVSADDRVLWEAKVDGSCQDAWLTADGNVLFSGGRQVQVVRPDKSVVWRYDAPKDIPIEIHSCQPLPDGGALFGEGGPDRIVELDRNGKLAKEVKVGMKGNAHDQMRQVRKLANGGYLVCAKGENNVYELAADGAVVRRLLGADMKKQGITWKALHSVDLLPNGNWLIGGGYDSTFCEVTPAGAVVWNLTNADVPALQFTYAAGCQRLPDGTTVVAAYHSGAGIFAVSPGKQVLWTCTVKAVGKPTHVKVLTAEQAARFGR
jgi:hypothetical protein